MKKREVAVLLPYKKEGEKISVFLQKREESFKVLPGIFSFFGGKIEEGETATQALEREIKEELDFIARGCSFLGDYSSAIADDVLIHVYYLEVPVNFETTITVHEGEYGKFFSQEEIAHEPKLIESDKMIIKDLYKALLA